MEDLQKEIDSLLDRHGIPQCAVVALNDDNVIFQGAFGENTITQETQFHLYSGTKLYTATAIMQLAEQGKLELDDLVTKYLSEDYFAERLAEITIRQLLGHASGLKDTPMGAFLSGTFRSTARPSSMDALKRYSLARARAPGALASYGNVNYAILGEVIERISGQSYEAYVQEHVLDPLNSKACFSFRDAPNLTTGWIGYWNSLATRLVLESDQYPMLFDGSTMRRDKRGYGLYSLAEFDVDSTSIGGLVGAATDFVPFLQQFLRVGAPANTKNHESPRLLSAESMKTMMTRQFSGQVGVVSDKGAGLGWKIGTDFVNHEGGGPGFTTEHRIYTQERLGIVVMMNRWSVTHRECSICHEICELVRRAVKLI